MNDQVEAEKIVAPYFSIQPGRTGALIVEGILAYGEAVRREQREVKDSPFRAHDGLMGATASGQRVTVENVHFLPAGSVVRLDGGDVLIHLHDDLWYLRLGACGWCYDTIEQFLRRLPGTLCHHP